jgi:RimJ/RimL family protein N-acetyltransferase
MKTTTIFETERLFLREFNTNDAEFVVALLNSPGWVEFIGDRGIKTVKDANDYIENSLKKSYKENGFGLWLVQLKNNNTPIGMCGLVNRNTLEDIDIGFAMLPDYSNLGYGFEAAKATLNFAKGTLKINRVVGITVASNIASKKLLNKLGLFYEKKTISSDGEELLVFSPQNNKA